MNRPIKFRAWNPRFNFMVSPEVCEGMNAGLLLLESEVNIPMQFTGVLDKNGVEIYEGDIMKWGDYCVKVVWGNSRWEFEAANGDHMTESFSGFADEYEVIGNTYQNSELLSV